MSDIFDTEKRSQIMRSIKSKNTEVERIVFKHLRHQEIYFQKHYSKAPGKPDIALPRKKIAVFIDSDFWHGKDMTKVTDNKFWQEKISNNKERDKRVNKLLADEGWIVLRIWESDILRKKTSKSKLNEIADFLTNDTS